MHMTFERILRLRQEAELTQTVLAQAINVSQRAYSHYERGQNMIPPRVWKALALYYNTSVDYLMGLTDNPQPYERGAGLK